MKTFWPSKDNKLGLLKLIYTDLQQHPSSEFPTIIGQVVKTDDSWKCIKYHNGDNVPMPHLHSAHEEADLRIPIHVLDCLKAGYTTVLVSSNDTDVTVILLYHMATFNQYGIKELWTRAGTGQSARYLPLHIIYQRIGPDLASVLPALHCLTGCDVTSKIGTKKSALKANPQSFLKNFGTTSSRTDFKSAEEFLVKVLKNTSTSNNFTTFRQDSYYTSKGASHHSLPPTSEGLLPHIERSFYSTYLITHALRTYADILPEESGYKLEDGQLVPRTSWRVMENRWQVTCRCAKCTRQSCPCRSVGVRCVRFCRCNMNNECNNPFQ